MISLVLMLALGIAQFYVLGKLLNYVLAGDMVKSLVLLIIKFVLYGTVIPFVLFVLKDSLIYLAVGYIAGVIISMVIYAVDKKIKSDKGDGKSDDGIDS